MCFRLTALSLALTLAALTAGKATASAWSVSWSARPEARDVVTFGTPSVTQDIVQTRDGYVWFAAMNGLFRYDGDRLAKHEIDKSGQAVRKLLAARDGGLWVASGGGYLDVSVSAGEPFIVGLREGLGGLFVVEQGQTKALLPADDAPSHWVWCLGELADGRVAMGTEDGLWLIDPRDGKLVSVAVPAPSHARHVASLLVQNTKGGDVVWFSNAAGVWRWVPHDHRPAVLVFAMAGVRALALATEGFWIVQDVSLHLVAEGKVVKTIVAAPGVQMRTILDAPGEPPWVATTFGLQRLRNDRFEAAEEALPQQTVRALIQDREGNVWAASKGVGVSLLRVPVVKNLGRPEGLPADAVLSLLPQAASFEAMWAATASGLVHVSQGTITSHPIPHKAPDWRLRNLAQQSDGTLWAGFDGLVRYKQGHTSTFSSTQLGGSVRALAVDPATDTVWLGFLEGGAKGFRRGDLTQTQVVPQGLCAGAVNGIVTGHEGGMWFLGPRGVAFLPSQATTGRCYSVEDVTHTSVTGLVQDARGTVWITATGSHGLLRLSEGRMQVVPSALGFPPVSLYAGVLDNRKDLWFSSYQGVFHVNPEGLDVWTDGKGPLPPVFHVDHEAGMRSADCQTSFSPSLVPWGDGGVMVATALGLVAVKPRHALPSPHIEPVVDSVWVDGVAINKHHQVLPGARRVEIRYNAPTFVAGTKPRFEQRLDGLDSKWRTVGDMRSALFTQLPAGVYTFRVRVEGEPQRLAAVTFTVLAPWYRQPWAIFLAAVLAASLLVLFYRLRLRQLSARFDAITNERTRIARDWHDGLSQVFLGIGYQLEALRMRLRTSFAGPPDPILVSLIDETATMIKDAQKDVKDTLWDLRASGVDQNRFLLAFKDLAQASRKRFGVEVHVKTSGPLPQAGAITQEWPRIAQEAVTNAVKHGQAKTVSMLLSFEDTIATLTIDDDGAGVKDEGAKRGSFGLVGMRERAARCGGKLIVEPTPSGVGTRLKVVVNLANHGQQRHTGADRG